MELVFFFVLLLVKYALCVPLIQVLQQIEVLSSLNGYIANSTRLTNVLATADNFTLLAPSDTAFDKWLGQSGTPKAEADIEETLLYHLLHGGFPTIGITAVPQFASSNLPNGVVANVTGGQVVEAVTDSTGTPQFLSGNKTASTISSADILCTGGIIQVVSNVLQVPESLPNLAQQAQLKVFVALLEKGGFLATSSADLIQNILATPDVTTFLPNSIGAMDTFTKLGHPSQARLNEIFNYHFVPGFKGYSSNLYNGQQLRTLQGRNLTVTKQGNDTFINGAKITTLDLIAQNGVAHVIDGILDPSNITTPPPVSGSSLGSRTGISDAVLGVAITFAILVPVALGIFVFWYFRQRRQRISEGRKEHLRRLDYQDKAIKFEQAGEQQDKIIRLGQTSELESPVSTRKSQLPFSSRQPSLNKKIEVFEMDGTSVQELRKNKALPVPR